MVLVEEVVVVVLKQLVVVAVLVAEMELRQVNSLVVVLVEFLVVGLLGLWTVQLYGVVMMWVG